MNIPPPNDNQQSTMDGPCEAEFTDAEVSTLHTNGLISRAEADVYNIIADFNDGQGGISCYT
ncbi:MAG: hypothetical protein H0V70_30390 [Ktedonobacteraceae bacterium]|jgi:hypothetical protein|nr:hypothetical protein [Ktedonobacteraceae bacterium]